MAFIKLIATDGRKAIINTDNVTALYNRGSKTLTFLNPFWINYGCIILFRILPFNLLGIGI